MKNFRKVIHGNPLSPARIDELEKFCRPAPVADPEPDFSQARYAAYVQNIIAGETNPAIVMAASARFAKTVFKYVDAELADPFMIIPAKLVIEGFAAIAEKASGDTSLQRLRTEMQPFYERAMQAANAPSFQRQRQILIQ